MHGHNWRFYLLIVKSKSTKRHRSIDLTFLVSFNLSTRTQKLAAYVLRFILFILLNSNCWFLQYACATMSNNASSYLVNKGFVLHRICSTNKYKMYLYFFIKCVIVALVEKRVARRRDGRAGWAGGVIDRGTAAPPPPAPAPASLRSLRDPRQDHNTRIFDR